MTTTAAAATEQNLGTIVIYRNGNTSDPQKKTVTIKKAASSASSTYSKVTAITSGAEYLFCEPTNSKVVSGYASNHLSTTAVTISGGTTVTGNVTIDTYPLVITQLTGSDSGYYSIKLGTKFIGYNSSTNFKQGDTVENDSYKWSITFDGDRAIIANKGTPARKIASNNGVTDFRPYSTITSGTNYYPVLFKKN